MMFDIYGRAFLEAFRFTPFTRHDAGTAGPRLPGCPTSRREKERRRFELLWKDPFHRKTD